ncbi:MAG: hypothetical protein HY682_10920 [Chloroflexi bacterium]|nr:hypothetical protein [Chloroflexota bacterium]
MVEGRGEMAYTAAHLRSDVERILDSMVRDLESKADCESCSDGDVYISGKDLIARDYARKIADLVASKLKLR